MGSDAAKVNTYAPAAARDAAGGKKKRTNRTARLKQCKLDARREQWLSQVKNKDCMAGNEHSSPPSMSSLPPSMSASPLSLPRIGKPDVPFVGGSIEPMSSRKGNDGSTVLHDNDPDSPISSPMSSVSGNNSSRRDCPSSSTSSGSYSRSTSDADEGDEDMGVVGGGLDDWEAVADALTTNDNCPPMNSEPIVPPPVLICSVESPNDDGILKKPDPARMITRAWRPDDVLRPQSLPNLSKQHSFPLDHSRGAMAWARHNIISQTSCPICYEDLDPTDTSFLPCSCGFCLCLFCHKRILEEDGRCPGCRKQYSPVACGEMGMSGGGVLLLSPRLSRSCRLG